MPIWPADWSQFIPDLIISSLVGVVLGIWLNARQKSAEARGARKLAARSWKSWRTTLATELIAPVNREDNAQDLSLFVSRYQGLLDRARKLDVIEWAEALPRNRELEPLSRLLTSIPLLDSLAKRLMAHLVTAINRAGVTQGWEAHFVTWSSMTILEVEDITAATNLVDQFSGVVTEVLAMPDIHKEVETFRATLRSVEEDYTKLRTEMARTE